MSDQPDTHASAGPSDAEMRDANVNPKTRLATDYLNAFNEPLMLLSLAGDDPDILEDLRDWTPPSYEAHFATSSFSSRSVIVAAYRTAPAEVRAAFDAASAALGESVLAAIEDVRSAISSGSDLGARIAEISDAIALEIAHVDGMIHGARPQTGQAEIDALFD